MSYPDPLAAFRLDGRVAIVTGASSGLGVGFAQALAAVGARVVLAARRKERLEHLAEQMRARGSEVLVAPADIASPEDCARVVACAVAEFGGVDVLVNNAGLGVAIPASKETPDSFRSVIDVNLNGAFWMAQECSRVMTPGSSIVNVASILGLIAPRYPQASYAASKAGLIGLTRDLAQQWSARKGIRVNALCPGYFRTEMNDHAAEQQSALIASESMLGRWGEQRELDTALLFLASPASAYVTGTTLVVDGGMSAL
ncbi:MAG: SDR family NAD(P)-dependent oxidoreductase [Sporichthyaceae bacterium]